MDLFAAKWFQSGAARLVQQIRAQERPSAKSKIRLVVLPGEVQFRFSEIMWMRRASDSQSAIVRDARFAS